MAPCCRLPLLALLAVTLAAGAWTEQPLSRVPPGPQLRGFGRVGYTTSRWDNPDGATVWLWRWQCTDDQHAAALLGKLLADLQLSAGTAPARVGELPALITASGAAFLATRQGTEARVASAASLAVLTAFAQAQPTLLAGAVAQAPYPAFLDRFDRYGWGCYGMGGFTNYHDWMTKADGQRTPKDPTEDVAFMIAQQFRFESWLDPVGFDHSDGLVKNTEVEWMLERLRQAGMPWSFRVYGNAGGADWTQRRFPEYLEQPASFLMSGWHGPQLFSKAQPHLTWFDRDIHRYMAVQTMKLMAPHAQDPLNMGWMHPHGELEHDPWYDRHDDYSPIAHRHWQGYLRAQGLSLAEVSAMYGQPDRPFGAWDQVPVPEFATFAGLPGLVQDLAGTWFWRRERATATKADDSFPGVAEGWFRQPLAPALWQTVAAPGSDALFEVLPQNLGQFATTFFRRSFTLTPAQLARGPLYLYWFPISHGNIHSGAQGRHHGVFINGEEAGRIGIWGALDVTKLLRVGDNQITVQLFGGVWNGRLFLSAEPPAVYPYLGRDRNRLFLLWQDWHVDAKYDAWEDILDGMRQVDPDRPIKFMAPIKFGADRWLRLAREWGGFGHFTGEGVWYFPWYKRYGFLYDLPATSEMGGPNETVAELSDTYRRTFLAGLNGHDPVFLAQSYTRKPDVRQWWVDHQPVLKRMGKYDLAGPQVLLYRSSRGPEGMYAPSPYPQLGEATRDIQNGWNWDLGRGTLQTLGQSMLYVDDGGLSDGKLVGYPLLLDCGNEVMPEQSVTAIAAWVRAGGTYVALPFSGRNAPLVPDVWQVAALADCKVQRVRTPGQGTVTFTAGQSVFRAFAGRTLPDQGECLDWIGNNLNLVSTELAPGPTGEVLATFENGAAAIVRQRLGAGSVIVLGTACWRQAGDRRGIWWPGEIETAFIADLLTGVGFTPAPCTTDDRLVWAQPYRTNNGLDAITCLVSWHDDQAATTTVRWRLPARPARLVSYGVDGELELPFTWADGVATAQVTLPPKEVKVLAAPVHGPAEALDHWWLYQQKMWHELRQPTVDFAPYAEGPWADPTLDLRTGGGELTLSDPAAGAGAWTPVPITVWTDWGVPRSQPLWLRRRFAVPEAWAAAGGRIFLVSGAWSGPHYLGSARLSLNGQMLHDFPGANYQEYDVTRLLREGDNELLLAFKGDRPYQGIGGNLYLYHWAPPARRVSLAGRWDAQDAAGQPLPVTFPGEARAWAPARQVRIPAEWAGKYQVRLYLEGSPHDSVGVFVNGRLVRRHHHWFGPRGDLDITRFLRFGEENSLVLLHAYGQGERDPKRPPQWRLSQLELHLRPAAP
jgi:hypothetical protein